MRKCLFLLSLCLLPFFAFSSTFTSENPIELPTATSANRVVLDSMGRGVEPRYSYRIGSTLGGSLGGQVYLGPSPNSAAPCPDGVFKYNYDGRPRGTPVRFIPHTRMGNPPRIFENQDINIQFNTRNCVDYTIWKVGEYNATLEARLLGTSGGTIGQEDSSWFKIVRSSQRASYHLLYCPGPFACPSCHLEGCQAVWAIMQDGRRRLALARNQTPPQQLRFPLSVNFVRS